MSRVFGVKNSYSAELHKSLVADEKIHELLRFTISTNVKKDVEQPYIAKDLSMLESSKFPEYFKY